jgi:hypothetical protein
VTQLQELALVPDCLTFELKLHPKWEDLQNELLFDKVLAAVAESASID